MSVRLIPTPTQVPIRGGEDVAIDPEDPWPSAYRGSKYSIIRSRKFNKRVMSWKYDDLQIFLEPPDGLVQVMRKIGKSNGEGRGSLRITADGEVLTKVQAGNYKHTDRAPVSRGWIPVYLGSIEGDIEIDKIIIQPSDKRADPIAVWEGLPFHHGETWTVSVNNKLIWKWEDYRFESAFDHSELIEKYAEFRQNPGRVYINEYGYVWVDIPSGGVPSANQGRVNDLYSRWRVNVKKQDRNSVLRLVRRRLEATGGGSTTQGHLPVYIGHVSRFDDGVIPRPVVSDMQYFKESGVSREN